MSKKICLLPFVQYNLLCSDYLSFILTENECSHSPIALTAFLNNILCNHGEPHRGGWAMGWEEFDRGQFFAALAKARNLDPSLLSVGAFYRKLHN